MFLVAWARCWRSKWVGAIAVAVSLCAQASGQQYPAAPVPQPNSNAHQPPGWQYGGPADGLARLPPYEAAPVSFPGSLDPGEPPISSGGGSDERLDALDPGEPGDGGDDDLEARLKAIEERLEKDQKASDKKKEDDAKKKADDASKPTLKWAGRIHTDYWAFPHTSPGANAFENGDPNEPVEDRFLVRRFRLGASGDIADNMIYRMEIDFGTPREPQIKDLFIGWEELPILQTLLVGHQKRPYGLDHINSSNVNFFMERPAVVEAFNQDTRRWGIQSWGNSEDLAYNWRYGAFMQQDMQQSGIAIATPFDGDYQAEFAGRFANTVWYDECSDGRGYAHWAIAGTIASPDGNASSADSTARFRTRPEARTTSRWIDTGVIDGAESYELLALEGLVNLGPFQAVGEFQHVWMQREGFQDVAFHGAYGYLSYFLTGEHIPWTRETGQLGRVVPFENFFLVNTCDGGREAGWGAWEMCVRYSYCDLSDADVAGGELSDVTFGINWYWNEWAHMQFNYIHGNIVDHEPVAGFTDADYDILGTRFLIFF